MQFRTRRKLLFGLGTSAKSPCTMPLCVREFFPDTFRTAYRQRARWTLGIGLQGWKQTGWSGSLANRYLLLRDRKGIVTAFVGILAYVLVLQFTAVRRGSFFGLTRRLLSFAVCRFGWMQSVLVRQRLSRSRCASSQRVYFVDAALWLGTRRAVRAAHGRRQLHQFHGGVAGVAAVHRASRDGQAARVGQDDARLPQSPTACARRRQGLGELLVSWQAIDAASSTRAPHEHAREAPLGRVLIARGWLDEETLAEAIAFQSDLPRGRLDPALVREAPGGIAPDVLVRMRALPQGIDADGHAVFAAASLLDDDALARLREATGRAVKVRIVRESEVAEGLRIVRGADATPAGATDVPRQARGVPLLGDLLIELGLVTRSAFEAALQAYRPEQHGRIGDFMVARHVITRDALTRAVAEQRRRQQDDQAYGR